MCKYIYGWVCDMDTCRNFPLLYIIVNGHTYEELSLDLAVAIIGASISSRGAPLRLHGALPLLTGYSL